MNTELDHGPCLLGEEYDKRIVELHANLPSTLSSEMERQVRRKEMDIAIDYRLGCNFPNHRRDQLWEVQERVEKKSGRLMFKYMFRRFFLKDFAQSAQNLAGYLVAEYAKVLSQKELEQYFGKDEARNPALPIDLDSLKK